LITDQALE